jgi:hypothetical protein
MMQTTVACIFVDKRLGEGIDMMIRSKKTEEPGQMKDEVTGSLSINLFSCTMSLVLFPLLSSRDRKAMYVKDSTLEQEDAKAGTTHPHGLDAFSSTL